MPSLKLCLIILIVTVAVAASPCWVEWDLMFVSIRWWEISNGPIISWPTVPPSIPRGKRLHCNHFVLNQNVWPTWKRFFQSCEEIDNLLMNNQAFELLQLCRLHTGWRKISESNRNENFEIINGSNEQLFIKKCWYMCWLKIAKRTIQCK